MSDTIPDAIAARVKAARHAEHQAALESLRQFGEPLAAPDPVIVIDMRLQAMVEVYDREWEEFDVEASVAFAASAARLRDARQAMVLLLEAELPTTRDRMAPKGDNSPPAQAPAPAGSDRHAMPAMTIAGRDFRVGATYEGKRRGIRRTFRGQHEWRGWVQYDGPQGRQTITAHAWARWAGDVVP